MEILKILQRKNQGFCPSTVRQNLTVAPIDLKSFLKGPRWTFVKSHSVSGHGHKAIWVLI